MAEFPYPEYRNLWRGSKLSKDRSAFSGSGWATSQLTDEGWEITAGAPLTGAYSFVYTAGAYRVPAENDVPYSWAIPLKNTGEIPFPVSITSWLERTTSGNVSGSAKLTLSPGETRVVLIEGLLSSFAKNIRFSLYYGAGDTPPPEGAKITLLDGITLTPTATAPDFPFNGDGAKPVETLKRRNLVVNPALKGEVTEWVASNGAPDISGDGGGRLEIVSTQSGTSFDVDYYAEPPVTPGQWVAISMFVDSEYDLNSYIQWRWRVPGQGYSYNSTPREAQPQGGLLLMGAHQVPLGATSVLPRLTFRSTSIPAGVKNWMSLPVVAVADTQSAAEAAVASYFDGDTPPDGSRVYRWAPDGTSLEIDVTNPPTGRTYVWDGEPYNSTSTAWVGDSAHATGVMDVGIATEARLGIVSDIYSRSREKIQLELARVDSQLIAGERVELDAAAMTASPVVWHWRQVTGPTVALEPREASLDFIAPDVDEDTAVRIAVYAASEDGRNRSDWHYFDLTIKPPLARFRASESVEFEPVSPKYVGYDRGKREIWNDVIPPPGFSPTARHETEIIDLGILPDDVQFTTGGPPEVAAAGGIYVDLETGDIYRNFGAGYNETDDTTAAPRTNAWWVNPATGDILEWIED